MASLSIVPFSERDDFPSDSVRPDELREGFGRFEAVFSPIHPRDSSSDARHEKERRVESIDVLEVQSQPVFEESRLIVLWVEDEIRSDATTESMLGEDEPSDATMKRGQEVGLGMMAEWSSTCRENERKVLAEGVASVQKYRESSGGCIRREESHGERGHTDFWMVRRMRGGLLCICTGFRAHVCAERGEKRLEQDDRDSHNIPFKRAVPVFGGVTVPPFR